LLTAESGGAMMQAVAKLKAGEERRSASVSFRAPQARIDGGHSDVGECCQVGQQVVALEDEAEVLTP